MKCPICGSPAADITAADFDGVSVRCLVDGDYDIAAGCLPQLETLALSDRQRALNKAVRLAVPGSRPYISQSSFSKLQTRKGRWGL